MLHYIVCRYQIFFSFSSKRDASALSASKSGKENQAASNACVQEEPADNVIPDSSQLREALGSSGRTPRSVRAEAPRFLATNNTRSSLKGAEAKVEEKEVQFEDTEREEERIKQVQQESSVVEPEPEP